jgi:hypothetical protein
MSEIACFTYRGKEHYQSICPSAQLPPEVQLAIAAGAFMGGDGETENDNEHAF